MYICTKCGALYTEEEVPLYEMRHTELEGRYSETFIDDCPCGGTIEEAKHCVICDDYYDEDSLVNGVCPYCLNHYKTAEVVEGYVNDYDIETCIFEVNGAFQYIFTSEEVNEILMQVLKNYLHVNKIMPSRLEDAINTYLQDDWAEYLAERRV